MASDAAHRIVSRLQQDGALGIPRTEAQNVAIVEEELAAELTPSREERVAKWVRTRIGPAHMARPERAIRLLEEAVELAQAEGITAEQVIWQTEHVYARPSGDPVREAGGVAVCLLGWCAAAGVTLNEVAERELERIEAKPVEEIRGSVARKNDADLVMAVREEELAREETWLARMAIRGDRSDPDRRLCVLPSLREGAAETLADDMARVIDACYAKLRGEIEALRQQVEKAETRALNAEAARDNYKDAVEEVERERDEARAELSSVKHQYHADQEGFDQMSTALDSVSLQLEEAQNRIDSLVKALGSRGSEDCKECHGEGWTRYTSKDGFAECDCRKRLGLS